MASQQFAGFAVLVALTFMLLALAACANSEQAAVAAVPALIAADDPCAAQFRAAPIGADGLRSRL